MALQQIYNPANQINRQFHNSASELRQISEWNGEGSQEWKLMKDEINLNELEWFRIEWMLLKLLNSFHELVAIGN